MILKNSKIAGRIVGNSAVLALSAMAILTLAPSAKADLVTNGSFEINGGNGQLGFNTTATGWSVPDPNNTSNSYTFIFAPGTADTTGAVGQDGLLGLWGPGNGAANGMPATSPDGGYYIGADPSYQNAAPGLTQTINGLTAGNSYGVSFWWAGAQQSNFAGPTTEGWQVSLGAETHSTSIVGIPTQGFSGWQHTTLDFTATSNSEVLAFFALGGPSASEPPFALLDGVTMTPEPSLYVILALGFMGLVFARRLHLKKQN